MESEEKNYSRHGMHEGDPGSIDPNDQGRHAPSKNVGEIDKLKVKESGYGHYSSQKPDTENLDQQITQIDEGTREIQEQSAKAAEKGTD